MVARVGSDSGAVTVEAAIGLGALTFVFGVLLAAFFAMSDQLRCDDAAQAAARLVARGDDTDVDQAAKEIAPPGARLTVQITGEQVTTDVVADPVGGLLPGVTLHGHAFALLEPGVADAPG